MHHPLLDLPILDLYEHHYRPARHPGDLLSPTATQYRVCLDWLNQPRQFCEWLPSQSSLKKLDRAEQFEHFRRWLRYRSSEVERARLYRARVREFSDELVTRAMSFSVEVGRERTTANKIRRHCNAVWKYAADELQILSHLPRNRSYRVNEHEPIALMPGELKAVIEAAARRKGMVGLVRASQWWPTAILFVYSLGVRISAARKVPTVNLDLVRGAVLVPAEAQKQRRDQWLDLFPSVVELLKQLRLAERGVSTVLGDWHQTTNTLRRHFKKILVDAGLYATVDDVPRDALFHQLRKTLASQLFAEAGIHVACDRLGHSTVQVTERYIDPRYRSDPRVSDLLPDPMGPGPDDDGPRTQLRIFRAG